MVRVARIAAVAAVVSVAAALLAGCGPNRTVTITMRGPGSTAEFARGGVGVVAGGAWSSWVCPDPDSAAAQCRVNGYDGTTVVLRGVPGVGFRFAGWRGAGCEDNGGDDCAIHLDADKRVEALFDRDDSSPTVPLTLRVTGTGGAVSLRPASLVVGTAADTCTGTCTYRLRRGTHVSLAVDGARSSFSGWGAACKVPGQALEPTCWLSVDDATEAIAAFAKTPQCLALVISSTPLGGGSVTAAQAPGSPPNRCGAWFSAGTSLVLTATPNGGWSFQRWQGACPGSSQPTCTLRFADEHVDVSAVFGPGPRTLEVVRTPTDGGYVATADGAINCPVDCSHAFPYGQSVTLTAHPSSGWEVVGWNVSGCSGTSCTVAVNGNAQVTVTFRTLPVTRPATTTAPYPGLP